MITVSGSVQTDLPPERTFAYLSQFEHTSEWDPGTPVVEKRSQGPVAVGHRYHAEALFRGKRSSIEYEVIELGTRFIKLRGENKTVEAFDSIEVKPSGSGSEVTYTAQFRMKGAVKLLQPLLRPAFNSLRDPALNGMKQRLQSLV
ncbi:Carbon monoxide dehydrogenase subunit G [Arthrobacter subterraneus]|uniref:Carbon monoxide dehydrogenase subunit G n=1 Tax=Arthrobacter subterraneus TaxID=335973 RepID=A0A1G8FJU4_9MICC|nr:SRPBCC family protein [Arthrobacter subterraneus]SDH82309.1 Carbon monoxide dehydrogenase subunit G [Arthrobacter subterraneus]